MSLLAGGSVFGTWAQYTAVAAPVMYANVQVSVVLVVGR
jgi:hypothetical protein